MINLFLLFLACAGRTSTGPAPSTVVEQTVSLASVHPTEGVRDVRCGDDGCTVTTEDGTFTLGLNAMSLNPIESSPGPTNHADGVADLAVATDPAPLNEQWNSQIANGWRSPFRREIPAPDGGQMSMVRGLTPGTSRIVRTGGGILTRPAPDPTHLSYPRMLALHPTGQEAYLIVWPNPHLTAFNAKTLQTTWSLDLGASALGLFVTHDGRYLVAETGGVTPPEQLLDYEFGTLAVPSGTDPIANFTFDHLDRPEATHTVVVDLSLGSVVARLPGRAAAMSSVSRGILVASTQAISWIPRPPE